MHKFLNTTEGFQSYECEVTQLQVKTLERLMWNIRRMWKCGHDGIYFNTIFISLWRSCTIPHCVQSSNFAMLLHRVCWVCWLNSWASIPNEMIFTWFYVHNILFLEIEININSVQIMFKILLVNSHMNIP